jgi:BirA family biotin operon repressor/biotin-[acetyl-CoA-carboxylase] ligase
MNHLLQLLADGQFHSGEELGAGLGVSRSAVWKCLQRLEAETGIELFRVPGKGYRLAEPLSLLDEEKLSDVLSRLSWGCSLLDVVDSTNAEALRRLLSGVPAPFVVTAEHQTAGRGRRGRAWMSPPAHNLLYTLALRVHGGPQRLAGLSLVAGLAVLRVLRDAGITDAGVKWPNDIYVADKKVAGILLEMTGDPADVCHVVIGIGINVNLMPGALVIEQPWTSMRSQLGTLVDRNKLVCLVSESLNDYLGVHERQGFIALRQEWEQNNIWQGKHCTLNTGSLEIAGKVCGVDDQGALRLLVGEELRIFSGGELSLRLAHDS